MVGIAELGQIADVTHGYPVHFRTNHIFSHIKGGQKAISVHIAGQKAGNGIAQTADTQQNGGQLFSVVSKKQLGNFRLKRIYFIADALLPKPTEAVKILPDLGGRCAHNARKFAGRNFLNAISLHGS